MNEMFLPPPFALRKMSLADLDGVLAVDRRSFPTPAKRAMFVHELNQNPLAHYQVLTRMESIADRVIGFSGYWLIGDEQHISTIAVHPDWRRRGWGKLLLLNMLLLAFKQPITLSTLEVRRSNTTAQALYGKYRFAVVGERKGYYKDTGDDAILMTAAPLDAPYFQFLQER
ncbi:MAG: ribosomal protein S18-alanine N-acetyltransferase, partial [Anaerolineae bacterium]